MALSGVHVELKPKTAPDYPTAEKIFLYLLLKYITRFEQQLNKKRWVCQIVMT